MWERDLPRKKKPFYRRRWFAWPVVALAVLGVIAGLFAVAYFEREAKKLDLAQLDQMESASLIYDRAGKPLSRIFIQNRDTVPYEEIRRTKMTEAVVAAEDKRFFSHGGVDYIGAMRALLANFRASRTREGASTVTQQLARNTFGMFEKTYDRKIREMFLAREIEKRLPKEKIMELYLNRVYFGQGFFGVQAAARGYFGKPAKELTLGECATLAGLLKSPNRLSPWSNRRACIAQRDFVLGRMRELELITAEELEKAVEADLIVKNRGGQSRDSYAMDMVRQKVIGLVGRENVFSDGYRIYTTIDAELQKTAEAALQRKLTEIERQGDYEHQTYAQYSMKLRTRAKDDDKPVAPTEYLQGAVVALENSSGGILAVVGGRDFEQSEFNRAVQATRPAGTAFTPLVYAAAFEKGFFPGALVEDSVLDNRKVGIGGATGILGEWGPERVDNKYEGSIPAHDALVKGKNAATVRLGFRAGLEAVVGMAKDAGIESEMFELPKTFLGSSGVSPMELTLAYTSFPNRGVRPAEPFIVTRVETKDGRVIFREKPAERRVMKATTAYEVHRALAEVLDVGTGDKAYAEYGLRKFPLGGKTGTSYGFTDAWFVGYSSAVTCGVWVGLDKPAEIYRGAFSNKVALPIWVDVMNASFAGHPARDFQPPRGLERYEVCASSGQLATERCNEETAGAEGAARRRRTTYFVEATPEQAPKQECHVHGDGGSPVALQQLTPGEAPRATLAVDVEKITPVMMQAPTVIGDIDPYGAVKPTAVLAARKADTGELPPGTEATGEPTPAAEPEVRRAEAVLPGDQPATDSTIEIEAPAPMDF